MASEHLSIRKTALPQLSGKQLSNIRDVEKATVRTGLFYRASYVLSYKKLEYPLVIFLY